MPAVPIAKLVVVLLLVVLLLAMMMPMTMIVVMPDYGATIMPTSSTMPIIMVPAMIGAGCAGLVLVEPNS